MRTLVGRCLGNDLVRRAMTESARSSWLDDRAATDSFKVALVAMPFGVTADRPAIQLGLLRALAQAAGFVTDSFHLYLDLAARLTPAFFNKLCNYRGSLTREWLFAVAAFGDQVPSEDSYFSAFPEQAEWAEQAGLSVAYLSALRREIVPAYVDDCLSAVDWGRYATVGFSSTFQQQIASLALARRIKDRFPGVKIVFGGANLDGEMGVEQARSFPFIDYVIRGEGDIAFPALLRTLAAGSEPGELPGLVTRADHRGEPAPTRDLDSLPSPNYDEFFERSWRLGLLPSGHYVSGLPIESSRGCWYGQKHHCTFCGLNDIVMAYRSKSPARLLDEIGELATKYRTHYFETTDEILNLRYLKEFFPSIEQSRADFQFFFETKANLTREQLRVMYVGGVRSIQPGIESLSSHVLALMRKGCTMLQNVRLLKWCRYYGIRVSWNLLWGFPGETEEDYRRELEVLRAIAHLQPPRGGWNIRLDRFSPYFEQRHEFPIADIKPAAGYRHVYPPHVNLERVAYFFDHVMADTVDPRVHAATLDWLEEWQRRWDSDKPDTLTYLRIPAALLISDRRGPGAGKVHTLAGAWAAAYEYCCETMHSAAQVARHLEDIADTDVSEERMVDGLDDLCRKALMIEENGQYLSLAIPVNPNW